MFEVWEVLFYFFGFGEALGFWVFVLMDSMDFEGKERGFDVSVFFLLWSLEMADDM